MTGKESLPAFPLIKRVPVYYR